jgi:type I restriction enzyme M protein
LIVRLAEQILIQFEGVELIDKYDVYQVLLSYWQEVMSDDVYLLIQDGYEAGRELSYEYVIKTKTEGDETTTEVTDKVKSWDGKLIPKSIIIDAYFAEEAKAIEAAEVIVADTQAQIDELLEGAEEGSAIAEVLENETMSFAKALKAAIDNIRSKIHSDEIDALLALLNLLPMKKKDMDSYLAKYPICASAKNDKGNVNASSVKARVAVLRETTPVPEMYAEDYEQLMSLFTLMARNDEQSKLVKALKAQLEEKVKAKYTVLSIDEIKELLVNKKWYYSIYDGIDALYVAISHNITNRIVELAERYEDTLPTLSSVVEDYEAKVKSHLERMGFVW